MAHVRLSAKVFGIVQGVGYRAWCTEVAAELGLLGWVRNLEDGAVELVAEGPREKVEDLERQLHVGPRYAKVSRVESLFGSVLGEVGDFRQIR